MAVREGSVLRIDYGGKMDSISRSPYAPFSIDTGLETLIYRLTTDIIAAEGNLIAVRNFQIGN